MPRSPTTPANAELQPPRPPLPFPRSWGPWALGAVALAVWLTALAGGLTESQTMRHVVLPQAVRRVAPPLLNDFISLQKDVALVSILGPLEAFRVAQIEASANFI